MYYPKAISARCRERLKFQQELPLTLEKYPKSRTDKQQEPEYRERLDR
jgi:hypothetical protein